MKYWKKLKSACKITLALWTLASLYMLFSGESGGNFLEWVSVWLFGCVLFGAAAQILSIKSQKRRREEDYCVSEPLHRNASSPENYISDYDLMDGHEFEHFCANIMSMNGFDNVEVTRGSGDHGIDILAEKDGISYAVQCKCYSSNIGNSAVQQAHTGKSLYHKDIAVVMTNRYFTAQAKEEAGSLGVKLWDREKLNDMIEHGNNP